MDKTTGGVRVRVFIPDKTWEKFEHAADVFGMDPRRLVETSAILGLRFLDMSLVNPVRGEVRQAMDNQANASAAELAGELQNLK